jgi:hypothetical protein
LRALYGVLTSDAPESALLVVAAGGEAELALLSARFIDALLDVRDAYVGNNEEFLDEIAGRWLAAVAWSPSMTIRGLVNRLQFRSVNAAAARQNGLPLYCWHGPAQREFVVRSGLGAYPSKQPDN